MPRASSDRNAIRVVSFDLDDTFWDCAPAIANAEQALYEWHHSNTPRITAAHDAQSLLQYRTAIREQYPHLAGCVTASRLQGLRNLLADFDYPQEMAESGFEVFYRARSEVVIYPQVMELLHDLSDRFKVAAITNGNADLEYIGIAHLFDKILSANLQLKAKPHRDMFQRCIEHFNVRADQVLHVGDNPVTDVVGGIEAGAQTLWFNQHRSQWPTNLPEPHFQFESIAQILQFLR